ncbi:MAG TPA: enoyl-CoA hydratase-related protein [Acidimicrobiales bacterium]|nr:enoyl-CoA hydratase-related protein [Acidimicrobiales bacterium]
MARNDLVRYGVEDGIAGILLHRPDEGNIWDKDLGEAYAERLEQAAGDPDVRVIVVTGAGDSFCAGGDLTGAPSVLLALRVPKPIIAAVNGDCHGVGLLQALVCDVRLAATNATFAADWVQRGLPAPGGASWLLPRVAGTGHALDLLLSGRRVRSGEAQRLGLVHAVHEPDDLMTRALTYASDVAHSCSPSAVAAVKAQVYRHLDLDLASAVEESDRLWDLLRGGLDAAEADDARREERRPRFTPYGAG